MATGGASVRGWLCGRAREAEVLSLIAEGLSNTEIAERQVVTETTVTSHVNHLWAKTGARDCAQVLAYAYRNGLAPDAREPRVWSPRVSSRGYLRRVVQVDGFAFRDDHGAEGQRVADRRGGPFEDVREVEARACAGRLRH